MSARRTRSARDAACGGFTLLELTVVLGLLGAFLVFLLQLLSTGVALFDEGEAGQELADLGNAASVAARDCFEAMAGPPKQSYEPAPPAARLLVQWVPLGLDSAAAPALVQAVRSTVRIDAETEARLLRRSLRPAAAETAVSPAPADVEARLDELVAAAPRQGRADMLLLPWPAGDADGAFLELRRGLWLPNERIRVDRQREVALMELDRIDQGKLLAALVEAQTEPIASGLLHVELAWWSQYTTSFTAPLGSGGPEMVWDSARAGLLLEGDEPWQRFSMDLGAPSEQDATDDVYPRWVQVTLVVARSGGEAVLAEDLTASATELRLVSAAPLGELSPGDMVKVGAEWIRLGRSSGEQLLGLARGQRGTKPAAHPRRTAVRAGKEIVMVVPLAHGRDCWNG